MEDYLVIAFKIVVLILLGFLIYSLLRKGLRFLFRRQYLPSSLNNVIIGAFRWLIIALVSLMILQQVGVTVAHLWAAVSAFLVLVAVGFVAVWSVLSNILCSVLLIIFAPFRIGDEIEVIEPTGTGGGLRGRVTGLNILFTTLEQEVEGSDARMVLEIPNNIFFQKSIRRIIRPHDVTKPLKLEETEA